VTLTDTGPLVALINSNDPNHAACLAASRCLPAGPLVTTGPCLTEAMYLVQQAGGSPAQAALWRLITAGRLTIHDLTTAQIDRVAALMDKYQDRPRDMADASLVAVAESLSLSRIFTIDSDFYFYRLAEGAVLEVVG